MKKKGTELGLFSLLSPCPVKSDASLFVLYICPGCSPLLRSRCHPMWINTALCMSQMLCKSERRRGRKSSECPTPGPAPMKTRGLMSPPWGSDQTMRLARSKTLLGGHSVPFPQRSAEVLCFAASHCGISCTFLWKLLVPATVRQDPGPQQPCCKTWAAGQLTKLTWTRDSLQKAQG